jgi:hypothetical protein
MHHNIPDSAGLICSQQADGQVPARAVGCFKLNAGRAMSLTPNVPGELRIAHGRVWVTFGHAADDASVRAGDYFLGAGDLLRLLPGQQLVMEVHDKNTPQHADQSVYFSWEPDAAMDLAASPRRVQHAHAGVRQPLLDLGAALHQAGGAFGRLVQGLAAHAVCTLTLRRSTP